MEIEGKRQWDGQLFMQGNIQPGGSGVVLVTTKNATVLRSLIDALDSLRNSHGRDLPAALIIDDEADQASLDTRTSKRVRNPDVPPGTISTLIEQVRERFSSHVLLEVTATPQALFLQDSEHPYRPDFTILIEPGKGYIGGNTFFSLDLELAGRLIRHVEQKELDIMLTNKAVYVASSLWKALCTFFIAATIKYLQNEAALRAGDAIHYTDDPKYCFLCHVSQKKADHDKLHRIIVSCHQDIVAGLSPTASESERKHVEVSLKKGYDDIAMTWDSREEMPPFDQVLDELRGFIVGTDVQIVNSDRDEDQPRYDRRYNILIGGNKLSRGVTIKNLIVTYYGRKAKSPNMDTVLQHARMYGYRARDLDVTRLFLTPEVEQRFRLINESEQELRAVIETYPDKEYQGIRIGRGLKATRSNVLNPNSIGSYAGGRNYFPGKPLSKREDVEECTKWLDDHLHHLYPSEHRDAMQITIDEAISIIKRTRSEPGRGGLWDTQKIIASLEKLKERHNNTAYLVVRRNRDLGHNQDGILRSVLAGSNDQYPGDEAFARTDYPTLFMFRLTGKKWDQYPFWVPNVRFPDGQYAILFNFN